jgi:hypothetical protein
MHDDQVAMVTGNVPDDGSNPSLRLNLGVFGFDC